MTFPISLEDVRGAQRRIAPFMSPSPLRRYPELEAAIGGGIALYVKHENFNPTGAFKVRNGLSFMSALTPEERQRGVVAATRGNHGLGMAYAGRAFGVRTTICVPIGNNPEKNAGMVALGAELIEEGEDFDEAMTVAARLVEERGALFGHSTDDRQVLAGAATISAEILEEAPQLDAMVVGVGGGSQAVGAIVMADALKPGLQIYGVQAEGASAAHDSWHAGERRTTSRATTFADGLATRATYDATFPVLRAGLSGFVTVSDATLANACRLLMRHTHSMVEGAAAAGLAGVLGLRSELAGKHVGIILTGANIDGATLRRVINNEL